MYRQVSLQTTADTYVYHEEDKIGEGGFGSVYAGEGMTSGMTVAIKRPHFYNAESLVRFKQKDCRYLPLLRHTYIIRVLDVLAEVRNERGEVGPPALIMEYVDGKNLQACWQTHIQKLAFLQKILLFRKICTGVDYAHNTGIVHRDLKPGNILLDPEGDPKIIDFGLAGSLRPEDLRSLSHTQKFIGSLLYMAPEQQEAMPADERSDIYSLGLILFFIFTGWHAKERLLKGQYTLQQMFDKYLPEQISRLCNQMCRLDKSKRARRLSQILQQLPGSGDPKKAGEKTERFPTAAGEKDLSIPFGIVVGLALEQAFQDTEYWPWVAAGVGGTLSALLLLRSSTASHRPGSRASVRQDPSLKAISAAAAIFGAVLLSSLIGGTFWWSYLVLAVLVSSLGFVALSLNQSPRLLAWRNPRGARPPDGI